jgi:cation-transporting ATPase 13A1
MTASGFSFLPSMVGDGATSIVSEQSGVELRVRAKYPFSSDLKRMSVLVEAIAGHTGAVSSSGSGRKLFLFCKGAPEVLAAHLAVVPEYYNATYFYHMSRGRRVLALAYKTLAVSDLRTVAQQPRAVAEKGLTFAGFLIFDCDLKADSRSVVRELRASSHQVVMITGDSVYTAADVARRLSMLKTSEKDKKADAQALIIHVVKSGEKTELVWRQLGGGFSSDDGKQVDDIDFRLYEVKSLAAEYSLCVVGLALDTLQKEDPSKYATMLRTLCPHVTIFARVSPAQKESIVLALNAAGLYTLMCGDGTNDVGALKAAHVGVSIVNSPELEKRIEGAVDPSSGAGKGGKKAKGASAKDRMARASLELQEQEQDPTIVKLGDASIASPFTARRTSIDSVLSVMRQGRCTLVTTVQVIALKMFAFSEPVYTLSLS